MKRIFAPLNRWRFVLYIFLFWIFNGLYKNFVLFFDFNASSALYVIAIDLVIIFVLLLKRLFDIFDKFWKSVIFALIYSLFLVVICILSLSTIIYKMDGMQTSNIALLLLYPICSAVIVLALSLEKGKNSKFLNFEWKTALKRTVLLVLIFGIYGILTFPLNAILPQADFRMYPSLEIFDRLLVNKIINTKSLNRGDIVCIKNKNGLHYPLRIIGLPNEEIKLEGNKIYINNELYSDEFAYYSENLKPIDYQETLKLDNNSYLLIGDNRYYDKRGEILQKDKNGNSTWKSIDEIVNRNYNSDNDGMIYLKAKRNDMYGKLIAVHYHHGDSNKKILRNDIKYAFALKNKKFDFNPSSLFENIFGKP